MRVKSVIPQLERFLEGFQSGAGVGLAGEAFAAQTIERLQLGFARLPMPLGQGLFRPPPGGAARL